MTPNLNKWKFIKLHRKKRIINLGKGNKGRKLSIYNFGVIVKMNAVLTIKQLETLKKAINKKLKAKLKKKRAFFNQQQNSQKTIASKNFVALNKEKKEKTFLIRKNITLGLTKKPLQVRMGKGKGEPVDWVYPIAKNRVLLEFLTRKVKIKKIKKIIKVLEKKIPNKMKVVTTERKIKKKLLLKNISNLKCVQEQ